MSAVFIAWGVSAAILILVAVALGATVREGPLGILIDSRGRYSLTQFQLVLWTIVIVSLISGIFFARLSAHLAGSALDFDIPDQVLIVLGISVGSAATSATIKASKDALRPRQIAASGADDRPTFAQMFWVEEGAMADKAVDVTKFQNFWFTLILVVAYVALAIAAINHAGSVANLMGLPTFDARFVTLLAISHAGYLAGKLPNPQGATGGLTLARRAAGAVPIEPGVAADDKHYVPRRPKVIKDEENQGGQQV